MINAVLIDDEKNALEVLQWQLQTYCEQVHVVATCSNAEDGIAAIRLHRPGLVFLDIEMPKKNGFDVLRSFPDPAFDTIFTTAYNQFAIKAFKVAAFDYLLKPIDAEDLVAAVQRFQKKIDKHDIKKQLSVLLQQFGPAVPLAEKVAFTTAVAVHFIVPSTIIYCESNSNYTTLHFEGAPKMVVSKTLKEVEDLLLPYDFYRVHHSFLINLRQVKRYIKTDGGYIEMADSSHVPVSRTRKDDVLKVLTIYPQR